MRLGATRDLTLQALTPGHYVLFCNLYGHYRGGMYVDPRGDGLMDLDDARHVSPCGAFASASRGSAASSRSSRRFVVLISSMVGVQRVGARRSRAARRS